MYVPLNRVEVTLHHSSPCKNIAKNTMSCFKLCVDRQRYKHIDCEYAYFVVAMGTQCGQKDS